MGNELALALIVKDEEDNLPRLLKSVEGVFDEIIVVDTGSTDKTVEIARSFGCTVHHFKWIKDFSAARNFAFSKVTKPWTMWMDADDILTPEARKRLLDLKTTLGDADAYLMKYDYAQDEFGQCICEFYRHRIVRTGKVRWEDPIHEHLAILSGTKEAMTNVVITHKRDGKSAESDKGRNISMLKEAVATNKTSQRLKFYYAKELYYEPGGNEESIKVFEDYLTGGDWHENMVQAYFWLAMNYLALKKTDKAIDAAMRGIRFDPRWAEYYCLIGQVHYDAGEYGKAIPWFEIAESCPIPETWGTVLTDNYTWVPRDRLCFCFSKFGHWRKAYEQNEAALSYRPGDNRLLFNRTFLRDILFDRLAQRVFRLNLGSGGKPCTGYRNCDLFPGTGVDLQFDLTEVPYNDSTIHAIRSEHALEHSPNHYKAEGAISEWARVLRPYGKLHLMVPDLEECCRLFIAMPDEARKDPNRYTSKEWYKYTIYGIQKAQGSEPDEGQFHRTGFTKEQLERLLESAGFRVDSAWKYDGFGTPSIEIEATLTHKKPRLLWMLPGFSSDDPSTRIRRMNVNHFLDGSDIDSTIFGAKEKKPYTEWDEGALIATIRNYDVVVFTMTGDKERRLMDALRSCGVASVVDYCEDLVPLDPNVGECLRSATLILCCSTVLAYKASVFGNVAVIPDAYEVPL